MEVMGKVMIGCLFHYNTSILGSDINIKVHVDVQGKASGGENQFGPKESLEQIAEQT